MAESNPTCSICLETYKDPITIPCNHVFCSGCLERHEEKNSREGSFACPLCNRKVIARVGVSDVDKRATNQRAVSSESFLKCDLCGPKISAARRCLECEENYCQACAALHVKMKALRNHTLRELGVLDQEDNVTLRQREFCPKHPKEELKIVCKTCKNIPLCLLCKISEHDNHKSRLLAEEVAEIRSALERNLTLYSVKMSEQHQKRTKECEAIDSEIDKSEAEEIMTKIKQEQELLRLLAVQKLKLEQEAQTIREGVKKIYEKIRKENDDCKKQLAKEFSDCETFHSEARKLIDTATGSAIMQIECNLRKKLLEEEKRIGNIKLLGLKQKAFTPAEIKNQNVQLKMGAIMSERSAAKILPAIEKKHSAGPFRGRTCRSRLAQCRELLALMQPAGSGLDMHDLTSLKSRPTLSTHGHY